MQLSDEERRFLVKRAQLVRAWRYVGAILLAVLIGLGFWLFLTLPLLVNPFVVMTRLQSGSIPESMLMLMAGMLPIVVLMCLALVALVVMVVLFIFVAFSNEKKYLKLIERHSDKISIAQQDAPVDAAKPPHC